MKKGVESLIGTDWIRHKFTRSRIPDKVRPVSFKEYFQEYLFYKISHLKNCYIVCVCARVLCLHFLLHTRVRTLCVLCGGIERVLWSQFSPAIIWLLGSGAQAWPPAHSPWAQLAAHWGSFAFELLVHRDVVVFGAL